MQRLCQRLAGGRRRKGLKKRAVVGFVNATPLSTIKADPATDDTILHDLRANAISPLYGSGRPFHPIYRRGRMIDYDRNTGPSGMVLGCVYNRSLASTLQA
jgi:hypothetical protein